MGPFWGPGGSKGRGLGRTHSRAGQREPHRQTRDYREEGVVNSFLRWTEMSQSDHGVALAAVAAVVWLEGGPAEDMQS